MDLQQEYYQRHGITSPLVLYPDTNGTHSLVLKNVNYKKVQQPRWIVLAISTHKQETHPTYYKFVQYVPLHDSYSHTTNPLRQVWERKVYVDEWHDFIVEWSELNRGELVPVSGPELTLALWEMFQYSHDTWLATNLLDRLKDNLFLAVDDAALNDDRVTAIKEVEEYVRGKNKNVVAALSHLRGYGDDQKLYASWLARLL